LPLSIGVLGATGYTGVELIRLLHNHPEVRITYCSSNQYNGKKISDVFVFLKGYLDIELEPFDAELIKDRCDIVFSCLPHGISMGYISQILDSVRVIDLSADFRLRDVSTYTKWYREHTSPELIDRAVYGLCEIYADRIKNAPLVANPGCYPTTILPALIPLLKEGYINHEDIIIDSKTGISGAGRSLSLKTHICESGENFSAYNVARGHRHIAEIEQELSVATGKDVIVEFTPHLIPVSRGMLSTIYAHTKADETDLKESLKSFYKDSIFIHILDEGLPTIKDVRGTNRCSIGVRKNKATGRAVIVCVIDNLTKGASGQAIQNMNIMMGLDEATGLDYPPVFP